MIKSNKLKQYIIIAIFIVIILCIISIPYYRSYVAPFNRTVIAVDNVKIPMKYFLKRIRLTNSDPMLMLQSLTNEEVIKLVAPQYGLRITDNDIENELRNMAKGEAENISDVEYREWYRQRLNESKMSDSHYREIMRTNMLVNRLQAYLAERVPGTAEQVHMHIIVLQTYKEAQKAADKLKAGQNFASVARELSIDTKSKDKGGDLGWIPVSISIFASQISSLGINQASDPMPYYSQGKLSGSNTGSKEPDAYYILKVSEKKDARPVSGEYMKILKENALESWLQKEINNHQINYNFNSEIYAWINWQLQKK